MTTVEREGSPTSMVLGNLKLSELCFIIAQWTSLCEYVLTMLGGHVDYFVALGLTILTVESVTKKAIEAYHIEWKKLQTQYSSPISNQDDLGEVLLSDNMVDGRCITPCITVNPHISVEILTSSCVEVGKEVTETGGQTPSQRSTIGQEYVMTQLSEEMMFQVSYHILDNCLSMHTMMMISR